MMPRSWGLLLLVLLAGCSSATRGVRFDMGEGEPIVLTPHPWGEPVEVDEDALKEALDRLASDAPVSPYPRQAARRLFEDSLPPRAHTKVRGHLGLISVEDPQRSQRLFIREDRDAEVELVRAYGRWCKQKNLPGDCLQLLDGGVRLDEEGKRTLAFRLALDSVWAETAEALEGLTDKDAVIAMLVTTGAVYFGLWLLPEPVSKGVAAVLTVGLIAYLGWDTVWSLIQGWRVLAEEVEVASTFDEIREAGHKYSKVMGKSAARVFVMLATVALGSTAQTMAAKLPSLPGYPQAAAMADVRGGFRLAAVGQVEAVAVSSGGVATITVAPGAVAMTARGTGGGSAKGRQTSSNSAESIKSLKARLAEHRQKLETYKDDPDAFDNQGLLKNAPSVEIRQRIIQGRIKHLEDEIRAFEKAIRDLGAEP